MDNILFIANNAALDGAPKSMLGMIMQLNKEKYFPYVLLPEHGRLEDELKLAHIDYFIVPYSICVHKDAKEKWSITDYWEYYDAEWDAVKEICHLIKELEIAVVHTNSSVVDAGAIAALIMRKPHIWHAREFVAEDFNWKFINFRLEQLLMKRSYVISISETIARMVRKRYGARTRVIYDGLECERYLAPVHIRENKDYIKIMIAGVISEGKGQKEAVEAVIQLLDKGYKVKLSIIGQAHTEYISMINERIKQSERGQEIQILPFAKDLTEIRKEHDIALVCSRCEALGRVTIEAMLAGMPVIGSNSGGTVELIGSREERGYLYTQGNSAELADKIEYVMLHPKEAEKKAYIAQEFAKRKFDIVSYMAKIEAIYRELVKKEY